VVTLTRCANCSGCSRRHPPTANASCAYREIERTIRAWGGGFGQVRIGVVRTNERVLPFWSALGFVPTGEVKPYRYASLESETIALVKRSTGFDAAPSPMKRHRRASAAALLI
jgi:hypothetical protein